MPELKPEDRLQPSLLDRLTDDEPNSPEEPRDRRVISVRMLHEYVKRDLRWLFNTVNLTPSHALQGYPEVATSVVNYGLPDLAGRVASNADPRVLEDVLRHVIGAYEPRIRNVKVRVTSRDEMSPNSLVFHIEGDLWAKPMPMHLFLKTEADLETGDVFLSEEAGGV